VTGSWIFHRGLEIKLTELRAVKIGDVLNLGLSIIAPREQNARVVRLAHGDADQKRIGFHRRRGKWGFVFMLIEATLPRAVPGATFNVKRVDAEPEFWLTVSHSGRLVTLHARPRPESEVLGFRAVISRVSLPPGGMESELTLTAKTGGRMLIWSVESCETV
jgi:hypothetical protein